MFDFVVRPGWIVYNPTLVTVLSCNQMFQPVYQLNLLWNSEKQVFKVKCTDDLQHLKDMLTRPMVFCVTRRQECEAMINGFDTDFVILLDPSDPKIASQMIEIVDRVEERLKSGDKFCFKIDLADLLDRLTLKEFKNLVYWHNTEFYITNHCRPNSSLLLNLSVLWCAVLPVFLMVSLPYRIARKSCCYDKAIHLNVRFKLEYCPKTVLVLNFYSVDRPLPGRYFTNRKLYVERDCHAIELRNLLCLNDKDEVSCIEQF